MSLQRFWEELRLGLELRPLESSLAVANTPSLVNRAKRLHQLVTLNIFFTSHPTVTSIE